MTLILYTTGKCNLNCDYCGGSFPPKLVPWEVEYSLDKLIDFIEGVEELVIAFYGGEPLLNPGFIMKVMDSISASKYVIQTNGTLVRELPIEYWRKFDTVLISIDGPEWLTDRHRGKGVYRTVIDNVKWLREVGVKADIVARMTVTEDSDIYRDVTHLLDLNLFDHVHWQLNFIWTEDWKDVRKWVEESYKPGLRRLVKLWIDEIRRGKILGIAPFQGILKRMKVGGPCPPCGSGSDSFTILTNGKVVACPIAVYEEWAFLGNLGNVKLKSLINRKCMISEPCINCKYFRICGGRCLYTYKERLWGDEGFKLTCEVTKYLIGLVYDVEPIIETEGLINEVLYPPFNNTIEITP